MILVGRNSTRSPTRGSFRDSRRPGALGWLVVSLRTVSMLSVRSRNSSIWLWRSSMSCAVSVLGSVRMQAMTLSVVGLLLRSSRGGRTVSSFIFSRKLMLK